MEKKYDVAVYGLWYGNNYGSMITYYALSKVLESMHLTYAMIKNPLGANVDVNQLCRSHPLRFAAEQYEITPLLRLNEMGKLNDSFDTFLLGSDQMWNYYLSQNYKQSYYFDFAADEKNKVAYGTSFGLNRFVGPEDEKKRVYQNLHRFQAISVRDDFSKNICDKNFDISATIVSDPVFLCPVEKYQELSQQADAAYQPKQPYLFSYVLDPSPEFGETLRKAAQKSGLPVVIILDELVYNQPHNMQQMRERLGLTDADQNIQILDDPNIKEWLFCMEHAQFVLTDSFHGACFSILFQKNFLVLRNQVRGGSRFPFLLGELGLLERMVSSPEEMAQRYAEVADTAINYAPVQEKLEQKKRESRQWLEDALHRKRNHPVAKPKPPVKPAPPLPVDVQRCKMIAALLRDYGVRHVVLSSGTRHVQLVKFFEANDCFITHDVLDERSAGFFALGLSAKIHKPVAVCCTSGTAASNYLTVASEAFYQHIPLIFITADRYPHLLNQREQQMVPQDHMFEDVCLHSVTLPTMEGAVGEAVARRLICETILEATHRTPGPVHINVPIKTIFKRPPEAYRLDRVHYDRIIRYPLLPDRTPWKPAVKKMAASKILVVYGQYHVLSENEQVALENLAKRFNCVVCTDNLSNAACSKSVNCYNMVKLEKLTPEYVQALHPDIVITVHGANVSAIQDFVVRSGKVEHWDVAPNGVPADPYKKLRCIFECTPTKFFKRVNAMVGDIQADDSYYQAWKKKEIVEDAVPESYCQKYAVYHTLKRIPQGSLLHLANSNTIRMACSYSLPPKVETFCNRGTNGIDGSASAFMGQVAVTDPKQLCFLMIGDLSFFYDMNSLWNKKLSGNIRIMLLNNSGAGLLRHHNAEAITYQHNAVAEGWVRSLGFTYLSSHNQEEFDQQIQRFVSDEDTPMFFEVFVK